MAIRSHSPVCSLPHLPPWCPLSPNLLSLPPTLTQMPLFAPYSKEHLPAHSTLNCTCAQAFRFLPACWEQSMYPSKQCTPASTGPLFPNSCSSRILFQEFSFHPRFLLLFFPCIVSQTYQVFIPITKIACIQVTNILRFAKPCGPLPSYI